MKCRHLINFKFLVIICYAALSCQVKEQQINVSSPDDNLEITFHLRKNTLSYTVNSKVDSIIKPSNLGLELKQPIEGGFKILSSTIESYDGWWQPVYGEYATVRNYYNELKIHLEEKGPLHRELELIFRAYNEGIAFRYFIPEQDDSLNWQINEESSAFNFPTGSKAFPIYRTEQTYSKKPVDISEIKSEAFLPLTVQLSNSFASVLEANVDNYPRTRLDKTADDHLVTALYGDANVKAPFYTPWRMVLIGKDEADLIENEFMILNLNPPVALDDVSWIEAGKTISNSSSGIGLQTDKLKKVVDFASENGFKYLQLDWGWYGTEIKWSKEQIEHFRKIMPERFKISGWEENAEANPYTVANGYVPYRWTEKWKNSYTIVDLDIHDLVSYAKSKGIGISLYVDAGTTLRSNDMDSLFTLYNQWDLAGLKPGFVKYGTQENTNWIRMMVEKAAEYKLLLCIHDARIPDGTTRTFPNLIINEGGGGFEGKHPVVQDVMLPFSRCLAGPFDYTPFLYTKGKSNAHMLSFFVVYYGPAQTVRGGYGAWNGNGNFGKGGEELEFLRKVPATWQDTKVIDAKIGEYIITARKKGKSWFIGGMTGDNPFDNEIELNFLDKNKQYKATVFKDDPDSYIDGFCSTTKEMLVVNSESQLPINMLRSGGFVAFFDPVD